MTADAPDWPLSGPLAAVDALEHERATLDALAAATALVDADAGMRGFMGDGVEPTVLVLLASIDARLARLERVGLDAAEQVRPLLGRLAPFLEDAKSVLAAIRSMRPVARRL